MRDTIVRCSWTVLRRTLRVWGVWREVRVMVNVHTTV